MIKGIINGQEYLVIGIHKRDDGSGYDLSFIDQDSNNKNGKVVGKVFITKNHATTLGKGLLDQLTDNDFNTNSSEKKRKV